MAQAAASLLRSLSHRASLRVRTSMSDVNSRLKEALAWLEKTGTKANRDGMARYAIPAHNAFGVSMTGVQELAKQIGHHHELAQALWDSGFHEARMLACFVDEPTW